MTKLKTRWDVCEQCLIERRRDAGVTWILREKGLKYTAQNRDSKWHNPLSAANLNRNDVIKLCGRCPYNLEHSVIAQEELKND